MATKSDQQKNATKKRGRPATGHGKNMGIRMHDDLVEKIDRWRAKQPDTPTRPEAVRRLVEIGLSK